MMVHVIYNAFDFVCLAGFWVILNFGSWDRNLEIRFDVLVLFLDVFNFFFKFFSFF